MVNLTDAETNKMEDNDIKTMYCGVLSKWELLRVLSYTGIDAYGFALLFLDEDTLSESATLGDKYEYEQQKKEGLKTFLSPWLGRRIKITIQPVTEGSEF